MRFEWIKAVCGQARTQQGVHMPLEIQTQILSYLEEERDYTSIARMSQVSCFRHSTRATTHTFLSQVSREWYHTFSAEHQWMARAKLHGAQRRASLCDWLVTFTKSYSKVCFNCLQPAFQQYDIIPDTPQISMICRNVRVV